uniref:Uncharacterized protein n=1 Tax=viral metagenome TaxID=1070528 RepID=A0A6C0EE69_9ZZZZ
MESNKRNREMFYNNLINKSEDKTIECIKEWKFFKRIINETYCICGHDILYNYYIKNIINDNKLIVGSTCIKQFMKNNEELIQSINKIKTIEKYIKNHEENKLDVGKYKNEYFKDIYNDINKKGYIEFISKNLMKNKSLKQFQKYINYKTELNKIDIE